MKQALTVTGASPQQWILHPPVVPYGGGYMAHLPVEVCDAGLHVQTIAAIDASTAAGLGAFLQGLADDWCGWSGRRTWHALEREMTIEACHDGSGHATLDVTVRPHRQAYATGACPATIAIALETGEQMTVLAGAVRNLLG
jgi:hypothetical protein